MSSDLHRHRAEIDTELAAAAFADGAVTFDLAAPAPALPPRLADEPMVVMSVRVPTSTYLAIKEQAEKNGVRPSVIAREWLELQQAEHGPDRPISLADAMRALATLRNAAA